MSCPARRAAEIVTKRPHLVFTKGNKSLGRKWEGEGNNQAGGDQYNSGKGMLEDGRRLDFGTLFRKKKEAVVHETK